MEHTVKTLVLGAGFFGLGYTVAHPDCLMIEESEVLGGDFIGCFRPPVPFNASCKTREGTAFAEFLRRSDVLCGDGRFDLPSLAAVVYAFAKEQSLPVLLQAKLVSIQPDSEGWIVEIFTNSGLRTLHAEHLIDVSSCRISQRNGVVITKKFLNLLCHNPMEGFLSRLQSVYPTCDAVPGFCAGEWIVRFPFTAQTSLIEARKIITEVWRQAFSCGEALIDVIGFDFEIAAESKDESSSVCDWIPGELYSNPVSAFDAGAGYQLRKENVR